MRGRTAGTGSFPDWIRSVMYLRRGADPTSDEVARAIAAAITEARDYGTPLVGDISNTLATSGELAGQQMAAVVFYELLGFLANDADRVIGNALDVLRTMPACSRRAPHDRTPRALLGFAGAVRPHPDCPETGSVCPIERAPWRIGRRDRVSARRERPVSGDARRNRQVGFVVGAAGLWSRGIHRSDGVSGRPSARGARCPFRRE